MTHFRTKYMRIRERKRKKQAKIRGRKMPCSSPIVLSGLHRRTCLKKVKEIKKEIQ
jgi:hypothetical protein